MKGAPPPAPQIREARLAVLEDVRLYAAQIVASVTRKDPASGELADKLLGPLADWPTRRAGAAGAVGAFDGAPTPAVTAQAD